MNDDQSVVDSIIGSVWGKVLFAVFMVASNWMILAVLTSVVSDHMISASVRELEADNRREHEAAFGAKTRRIQACFKERDSGKGVVSKQDFASMLSDPGIAEELCHASELQDSDLKDLFYCLCDESEEIRYDDFINLLHLQSDTADKRDTYKVMAYVRDMEHRMDKKISKVLELLGEEELPMSKRQSATKRQGELLTHGYVDFFSSAS